MPSKGTIAYVVLHNLDLNFQSQTFQVATFTSKCWKNATNTVAVRSQVKYLPSNGAAANIVDRDRELHFKINEF